MRRLLRFRRTRSAWLRTLRAKDEYVLRVRLRKGIRFARVFLGGVGSPALSKKSPRLKPSLLIALFRRPEGLRFPPELLRELLHCGRIEDYDFAVGLALERWRVVAEEFAAPPHARGALGFHVGEPILVDHRADLCGPLPSNGLRLKSASTSGEPVSRRSSVHTTKRYSGHAPSDANQRFHSKRG